MSNSLQRDRETLLLLQIAEYGERQEADKQRLVANAFAQRARKRGMTLDRCFWPDCNASENIYAHHDNHANPHIITPLCSKHHAEWHKKKGNLNFDLMAVDIKNRKLLLFGQIFDRPIADFYEDH